MASNIKRIVPMFDRVLVQRFSSPKKTTSGILIPEKATSKLNEGEVLAVGEGGRDQNGKLVPVSIKVGDTVLLPEYGGSQIKLSEQPNDDKEYYIYREAEIVAKLSK